MSVGLPPKKALGQHFLHDPKVLARIAALAAPVDGSGLVEIGPGTGNLTAHLVERYDSRHMLVIERDRRMPEVLRERFGDQMPALVEADAVRVDYRALFQEYELGPQPVVVGNLPYNAGVPIVFAALAGAPRRCVVMLQKEVAQRIVARPGSSSYGQLSVKLQMLADTRMAFKVGRGAFRPPPKVMSAVVVLQPLAELRYSVPDQARLWRLLEGGFGQRRKTLARALGNTLKFDRQRVQQTLEAIGHDHRARAEVLDLQSWANLANALQPHWPQERA